MSSNPKNDLMQRISFFRLAFFSKIVVFACYIKFLELSLYSNTNLIRFHINEIIRSDKAVFEQIFRTDVVFVLNRTRDEQINQMFGNKKKLWQFVPFLKNILRFNRPYRFHKNYVDKNGVLKRYSTTRIFFEEIRTAVSQKIYSLCNFIINTTSNYRIFNTITNWFSDEIFVYKRDGRFVQEEFFSKKERLNFFNQHKEKMFFFSNPECPTSYSHVENKIIHEKIFEGHFSQKKNFILAQILERVIENIVHSQLNVFKKVAFFLLHRQIRNHFASLGIFINLHFESINMTFYDVVLNPLTYDKGAVYMSFFLRESDPFLISLFHRLNENFKNHVRLLFKTPNKIEWNTTYIDSIFQIFLEYAILKKSIDITIYPEIIPLLFPIDFFSDRFENYGGRGLIRTVIDFSLAETFSKYSEYFNHHKIALIRAITDKYMSTLSIR